jgi:hypothetical protein
MSHGLLEQAMWMVWFEGRDTVGPVSANQIAWGIRAGHVPRNASIQRKGDVFWTGILEEPAVQAALDGPTASSPTSSRRF